MKCLSTAVFAAAFAGVVSFVPAWACSTFVLQRDEGVIFGKNYDWDVADGLVFTNKRGVRKEALVSGEPARWTSIYGSVTFNQYGREFPSGGMNEAGLVIELMWLSDTSYPVADERPELGTLQWIQYQLDTATSVEEVVASDRHVRISSQGSAKVHYLVSDRSGACASIEFVGGQLVVHTGDYMPVTALTNNTYRSSMVYLKQFEEFGGANPIPRSRTSLDRFARVAQHVRQFESTGENAIDYAFDVLADVAQGRFTKWSIVYDVSREQIHFKTLSSPPRRRIDMKELDFSCATPVGVLDIDHGEANVTHLMKRYSYEANLALIKNSFRKTSFLSGVPDEILRRIARYPDGLTCDHAKAPHREGAGVAR